MKSHEFLNEACWSGYKQVGMKKKGSKNVPNCVPVEENASGDSSLHDWFSKSKASDGTKGWVQIGGKYAGKPCAKQPGQTTKPKCGSSKMKRALSAKEEEAAARRKRKEDPNPDRRGKAKNVATKSKTNEAVIESRENFNGINLLLQRDDDEVFVKASAGGRELGHVLFVDEGDYLMPQDLEVNERFQGQGIAKTMYDYVKSKGYKIRRSGQQTDAGAGFWDKHRPEQNVWEERLNEKWSKKYKDSINCSNPKGFSQKAHCAGKKKTNESDKNSSIKLGNTLSWPEFVNKISSMMKATGWKSRRLGDNQFMFITSGTNEDEWFIIVIDNVGDGFFSYGLGTVEEGQPYIDDNFKGELPTTEASLSELMNMIRDGYDLNESTGKKLNEWEKTTSSNWENTKTVDDTSVTGGGTTVSKSVGGPGTGTPARTVVTRTNPAPTNTRTTTQTVKRNVPQVAEPEDEEWE